MTNSKQPKRITYITDGIKQRSLNKLKQAIVDTLQPLKWVTHYNFFTNVDRAVEVLEVPSDDELKAFISWWMVNNDRVLEMRLKLKDEDKKLFIQKCMALSHSWRFPSMRLAFEGDEEVHWKESNIGWEDHKAWYETQERLETVVIT